MVLLGDNSSSLACFEEIFRHRNQFFDKAPQEGTLGEQLAAYRLEIVRKEMRRCAGDRRKAARALGISYSSLRRVLEADAAKDVSRSGLKPEAYREDALRGVPDAGLSAPRRCLRFQKRQRGYRRPSHHRNGPFSFPNGAGHAVVPAESTRASQDHRADEPAQAEGEHRDDGRIEESADDEVLRLRVAFTSRDDRRDGDGGEGEHGGQVADEADGDAREQGIESVNPGKARP